MNAGGTTWRDFTLLLVMAFFVFVVWMLPHLNPPAMEDQSNPPGNVIVHIVWPNGNIDVDLWLWGPEEIVPVGYSNKSGQLWNLLRDDTGTGSDLSGINYENAYTRGVPAGEYIINVHCYKCGGYLPVLVKLEVTVKVKPNGAMTTITYTEAELVASKEEITMVRFELDRKGKLVPGSMSHLFESLRDTSGVRDDL
jgi:hypothetical protein